MAIYLPIDMRDTRRGRQFWILTRDEFSEFLPLKYGNDEPLKNQFLDGDNIDVLLGNIWAKSFTFIWSTKVPGVKGIWTMTNGRRHTSLFLYGPLKHVRKMSAYFDRLVQVFDVDFGFVHALTKEEFCATRSMHNTIFSPFDAGLKPDEISKYVPNLAWETFFGRPYMDIVDRKNFYNLPGFSTYEKGGGVMIVSEMDPIKMPSKYFDFDADRSHAKEKIGQKLFFSSLDIDSLAPTFRFLDAPES